VSLLDDGRDDERVNDDDDDVDKRECLKDRDKREKMRAGGRERGGRRERKETNQ
jgi:hypothetical protein